jgi:hypothetical protein
VWTRSDYSRLGSNVWRAVAADEQGNIFVGGSTSTVTYGSGARLLRYDSEGVLSDWEGHTEESSWFPSKYQEWGGAVLDIAVAPNGTVVLTGVGAVDETRILDNVWVTAISWPCTPGTIRGCAQKGVYD